jgi:hypothetical protein
MMGCVGDVDAGGLLRVGGCSWLGMDHLFSRSKWLGYASFSLFSSSLLQLWWQW